MAATEDSGASPVEQVLTGGVPQRVGWYRYYFADERWEWSPEVEALHGYAPGTAQPTTDMVLSHKHPHDYPHVSATVHAMRESHRPFSTRHRIITVQGQIRDVVVIGEELRDDTGTLIGTHGYYLDVTRLRDAQMDAAVAEIADSRAPIEQVKGVLSVVYRVPPEAAFDILKWRSQETNVKLRTLAEQLMTDFAELGGGQLPPRTTFDHLLLTAHQRVQKRSGQRRSTSQTAKPDD